ncbi:MAG: CapA family protein [Chloroflexota bacterium]
MNPLATLRGVTGVAVVTLLVGCASPSPSLVPSPSATPTPSPSPTATPIPDVAFPLAVVTGLTNLRATITLDELATLASEGQLVVPCGVTVNQPDVTLTAPCVAADQIAADVRADQTLVALLPPGLVEPATKVLSIAGEGPFGLFGPDLFGDPESRALPYAVNGSAPADGPGALDPAWTAYDASQVWTLTSIGSLCADRVAAYQAVTLGKGWDWPFNGGTATYTGEPFLNPNPPAGISKFPIVKAVEAGNDGLTASISKRSDVALADHKCPILRNETWVPNQTGPPSLAVPEAVLTRWENFLGIDAVYLAADHQSDRGVTGIRSTLEILDEHGLPHTGLGMNLDQALEPAYVEVAGLKVAFVSWNEVTGPAHAGPTTPGVAWLEQANVDAAVGRARAAGADLVVCDPQWWGGDEYHPDLWASQLAAVGWMDEAGCDQIIGGGLHIAGGIFLRQQANGVSLIDAGPGNYMYGQPWWQQTQEGIILDMTFRGTTLVNVRLRPYVMILNARPTLTDPEGDGHYVLERVWKTSEVAY